MLSGFGERAHHAPGRCGLDVHVKDVSQHLAMEDLQRVVLVDHSYAGCMVSGVLAARTGRVAHAATPTGAERLGGLMVPPPDPSIWGFEPDSPDHSDLQQRLTPQPLKTMTDAPRITGRWKQVASKCHLLAAGPPASRFAHHHAACQAEPGWITAVVPGGHEMMWTHPEDLLRALSTCIARHPRAAPTT